MANHKSAKKRIRSDKTKKLQNRYYIVSCRTMIKELKKESDKTKLAPKYNMIVSRLDKLSKKNRIHKNKASNLKSKLAKYINKQG